MSPLELAGVLLAALAGVCSALVLLAAIVSGLARDAKEIIEARCERLDIERARREEALAYRTVLPLPPTARETAEVLVHAESFTREAALS